MKDKLTKLQKPTFLDISSSGHVLLDSMHAAQFCKPENVWNGMSYLDKFKVLRAHNLPCPSEEEEKKTPIAYEDISEVLWSAIVKGEHNPEYVKSYSGIRPISFLESFLLEQVPDATELADVRAYWDTLDYKGRTAVFKMVSLNYSCKEADPPLSFEEANVLLEKEIEIYVANNPQSGPVSGSVF